LEAAAQTLMRAKSAKKGAEKFVIPAFAGMTKIFPGECLGALVVKKLKLELSQ